MKPTPDSEAKGLSALFAPVDPSSVVFFRVTFGLLMVWHLREYLLTDKVHLFTEANVLFKFYGFEWVQPGPEWAMRGLFWVQATAALFIALGFLYRVSATVFVVINVYVMMLETALVNNHDYLITLLGLLLIFVPAHQRGSLDAAFDSTKRSATIPAWALWVLRFQIAVPYTFGALAKINRDWLLRGQPMTLWLEVGGEGRSLLPDFLRTAWAGYFFSWSGFLLDLLIVPLLLYRRTRRPAFVVIVAFHLTNVVLFDIAVFPWLMICATTIFFAPDWPQRVGLMKKRPLPKAGKRRKAVPLLDRRQRLVVIALATYVAVQILLPFRHFLYPGNVDWTEEGIFFAWHMKLRDKVGDLQLVLVDKETKRATVFEGMDQVLTGRQLRHVIHDPDMVLQFVHHLAGQLQEQGRADFEIRAVTNISFNGREPQPIIDPTVDLASTPRKLGAAVWILPFEE